jgi:hypothetical protein
LAFAYFDQARRIWQLGSYIRDILWPTFRLLSTDTLPSWEESPAILVSGRPRIEAVLSGTYLAMLFVVAPSVADIFALVEHHGHFPSGDWVVWTVGLLNLVAFCMFALAVAGRYGRRYR